MVFSSRTALNIVLGCFIFMPFMQAKHYNLSSYEIFPIDDANMIMLVQWDSTRSKIKETIMLSVDEALDLSLHQVFMPVLREALFKRDLLKRPVYLEQILERIYESWNINQHHLWNGSCFFGITSITSLFLAYCLKKVDTKYDWDGSRGREYFKVLALGIGVTIAFVWNIFYHLDRNKEIINCIREVLTNDALSVDNGADAIKFLEKLRNAIPESDCCLIDKKIKSLS